MIFAKPSRKNPHEDLREDPREDMEQAYLAFCLYPRMRNGAPVVRMVLSLDRGRALSLRGHRRRTGKGQ